MKSKGIILVALLCIFAISGCSKETNTATTNSETSSTQITASEETSAKNEMTIVLKDNETGNLLENKVVEDEEKITAFNQMCSGLKNSTDEKYSEVFFDSITSSEYTLNFSSSDFAETTSEKGDVVIVECNGFSQELAVGGEDWQKIADFLDSISKQIEQNIELIRLEQNGWLFKPQLLSKKICLKISGVLQIARDTGVDVS